MRLLLNGEALSEAARSLERDAVADHERDEALARLIKPGDIVIDVGANRGQFALDLVHLSPGRIFAFEPTPSAFRDLEKIADNEPLLTPIFAAVAQNDGHVSLHVQESDLGSSLLAPLDNQPSQWLTPREVIEVPAIRLETFIEQNQLTRISLLKSDAQGLDGEVVESAGRFLDPEVIHAILVEMNFHTFYKEQEAFHDVMRRICSRGYFVADMFRHYNREGWLWWADVLFLPDRAPFSTQRCLGTP